MIMKLESTLSKSSEVSPGALLRLCTYSDSRCYDCPTEHADKKYALKWMRVHPESV
jgi:hypothetical protein